MTGSDGPRFGVILMQDTTPARLSERFRRIEELGLDQLYLADHMGDFRDVGGPFHDGWSMLAAAAVQTERIRIGTLVANPILRPPALLAKQAITVDHLSGGRLDLGIGAGVFELDHHAVGSAPWTVRERVSRFAEYVEILDGMLRTGGKPYTFDGAWYQVEEAPTAPGPVQDPRPPIIVGGQAPTMLRVTAQRADVWNTNGRFGAGVDEIVALTREQNRRLDELCAEFGRDPATLRRSILLWDVTDPLRAGNRLEELVDRFTAVGIDDFVIGWPDEDDAAEVAEFERLVTAAIPSLRAR